MEDLVSATPWRGRRVLITGHTGFKGAWLATWLDSLGARVSGIALPPTTNPNLYGLLGLDRIVDECICDVRDQNAVAAAVRRAKPDVVFHLAAQALVRRSYLDPVETFSTNVMGTVNLLDAVRAQDVAAVVVVTSDKCYEQRVSGLPFKEDDRLGGHDPYSASKAAAEVVTASYRSSFFAGDAVLATVRAGNVIGGGDWSADRLVADVVAAASARRPLRLRYPDAVRPWQHVTDALSGYLLVAERALAGDRSVARAWNFGPTDQQTMTVADMASLLLREMDSDIDVVADHGPTPHEAHELRLDSRDAVTLLGWRPHHDATAAVAATARWFRGYRNGTPPEALTRAQLPIASAI